MPWGSLARLRSRASPPRGCVPRNRSRVGPRRSAMPLPRGSETRDGGRATLPRRRVTLDGSRVPLYAEIERNRAAMSEHKERRDPFGQVDANRVPPLPGEGRAMGEGDRG